MTITKQGKQCQKDAGTSIPYSALPSVAHSASRHLVGVICVGLIRVGVRFLGAEGPPVEPAAATAAPPWAVPTPPADPGATAMVGVPRHTRAILSGLRRFIGLLLFRTMVCVNNSVKKKPK